LVGDANAELARYDGLLQGITNPQIMFSPLTNEEAVLSSKIEGTQATVDEVLEQPQLPERCNYVFICICRNPCVY